MTEILLGRIFNMATIYSILQHRLPDSGLDLDNAVACGVVLGIGFGPPKTDKAMLSGHPETQNSPDRMDHQTANASHEHT